MLDILKHDPLHQLPDPNCEHGSKHKTTDCPVPSQQEWSSITATALRAKELLHYTDSSELVGMHQEEMDQQTIYGGLTLIRLREVLLKLVDRLLRGTPYALYGQHCMASIP